MTMRTVIIRCIELRLQLCAEIFHRDLLPAATNHKDKRSPPVACKMLDGSVSVRLPQFNQLQSTNIRRDYHE